jgi:hypothetical protein
MKALPEYTYVKQYVLVSLANTPMSLEFSN